MRKGFAIMMMALMIFATMTAIAEKTFEEEYEEGLYIYSPAQGKLLPWVETEQGNEYQIVGLALPDSTVELTLMDESGQIWQEEVIAEGNGYFQAAVPAEKTDKEHPAYTLKAVNAAYEAKVEFSVYPGTLSEFAMDPLHLDVLPGLTKDERGLYEWDMQQQQQEEETASTDGTVDENVQGTIQLGPNEFRTKDYTYLLKEDGTASLRYYYGHEKNLVLPELIDGYPVTEIGFDIWNLANSIVSVTIPSGATIPERNPFISWERLNAFYVPKDHPTLASVNGMLYTKDLRTLLAVPVNHPDKDIVIPEGTAQIEYEAFFSSTLRNIEFPETLRRIGRDCFPYAYRLKAVTIPDSVRVLGEGCFRDCGIHSLSISSRASVMNNICYGCQNLKEIVVMPGNETVKTVDGVLFSADGETLICYPVQKDGTEYTVPAGTVVIGENAFYGANQLKNVIISDTVDTIEAMAFATAAIQSVEIPDSVVNLGDSVFENCFNLDHFVVSASHPVLDAVEGKYLYSKDHKLFYCYPRGLHEERYVLEKETEEILPCAFEFATLSAVVLPDNLKKIGFLAFADSKLKSIYIPGTVEFIGNQAFSYCPELENVALGSGASVLDSAVFYGSTALKSVSVPDTVREIGELSFLDTGNACLITTENSFAHQYAIQNNIPVDVTPGNYEHFTQSIKDEADPMIETQGPAKQEVVISGKTTVNIREKPGMDSRRVGRGAAGDRFKWLETVEKDGVSWYKIELEDGSVGYIHSNMAELVQKQ